VKLRGKRALVTGAARRVGAAIARALAAEGCRLVLHHHRNVADARRLAGELRRQGVSVELFEADFEKEKEVAALGREVLRKGPVDILVNNASVFYPTPFLKIAPRDWTRFLSLHLQAPYLLARTLGPKMKKGGGRIVNIVDGAAKRPYRNYLPYCVSKGALLTLTKSLALELAPGVQVNAILPGPIAAAPWEKREVVEKIRKKNPLQKWGGEEEIAKAVVFLCLSDFTSGADFVVDGGHGLV
jgi:NAD(P)-dependent dehydrogenase (short-subunit alcohol dehydrogenase family)